MYSISRQADTWLLSEPHEPLSTRMVYHPWFSSCEENSLASIAGTTQLPTRSVKSMPRSYCKHVQWGANLASTLALIESKFYAPHKNLGRNSTIIKPRQNMLWGMQKIIINTKHSKKKILVTIRLKLLRFALSVLQQRMARFLFTSSRFTTSLLYMHLLLH